MVVAEQTGRGWTDGPLAAPAGRPEVSEAVTTADLAEAIREV